MPEDNRESLRSQFKPKKVKFLFVGESPPKKPEKFFYKKTGALFRNTSKAFAAAGPPWAPEGDVSFLEHFCNLGCYLVDFCKAGETVKSKSPNLLDREVGALSETIRQLKPKKVIVVIKRIKPFVVEALKKAELQTSEPDCMLAFPAHGHQKKYREGLKAFLRSFSPQ